MYKYFEKQTPSTMKESRAAKKGWEVRQEGSENKVYEGVKAGGEVEAQKLAETNPITPLSTSASGRSLHMRNDAAALQQTAPKRLKLKDYMHLASI